MIEDFFKLFVTEEAGNLGTIISAIAIVFIAGTYLLTRQQKNTKDFQNKVNRTFYYGKGFKRFYESFIFLHFNEYLENILKRGTEESFKIINIDGTTFTGGGAVEKVRQEASTFYLFLQELMYILRKNKELDFIDETELRKVIKSYSVQIKDFFSVVDIIIAGQRRINELEGWGSINEEDFATLKNFFQNRYIFLK